MGEQRRSWSTTGLALVLGYQAFWLDEHARYGPVLVSWWSRPPVWWPALLVTAVGAVWVLQLSRGRRFWWKVAVLVGPAAWLLEAWLGQMTRIRQLEPGDLPSRWGHVGMDPLGGEHTLVDSFSQGWAFLAASPGSLIFASLLAALLRWAELRSWVAKRVGPLGPRVADTALVVALSTWFTYPWAAFTWPAVVAVTVVVPAVVALDRRVTPRWGLAIGPLTGGLHVLVLLLSDTVRDALHGLSSGPSYDLASLWHWLALAFAVVAGTTAAVVSVALRRLAGSPHP